MRRLIGLFTVALLVAALWHPDVAARGPSCDHCPPTIVVANGDGSVTVSTTATSRYAQLNVRWNDTTGVGATGTDGGPSTLWLTACPCTVSFWEHGGQWHQYSATSESFTP